jgi:UPF0716 family protein affecting phage T7 exclusion
MSRTKLIALGYPVIELIALWLVAQWIGWGSAILLLLLGIPVGFIIMGKASRKRPVWFLAGLFVAIPGFVTDLFGFVLLLPPIQRALERRGRAWLESNVTFLDFSGGAAQMRSPYDSGEVIPGMVIHDDEPRNEEPRNEEPRNEDGPPFGRPSIGR